jgi:hypothetical protein
MTVLWHLLNLVLFTFGVLLAMKALDFAGTCGTGDASGQSGTDSVAMGRIARTSIDGLVLKTNMLSWRGLWDRQAMA